jgi:hypothetical protein
LESRREWHRRERTLERQARDRARDRFVQPRRRLAGRRSEPDAQRAEFVAFFVLARERLRLHSASSLTMVVVLPVPEPPVTMLNALFAASAQAIFCQLVRWFSSGDRGGKGASIALDDAFESCDACGLEMRSWIAPHTACS